MPVKYYKNLILNKLGLLKISTVILVLTEKCNLRCRMCDIWEKMPNESYELQQEKIRLILGLNLLKNLKHIAFTGGEPFLKNDLNEIYNMAYSLHPNCYFSISTNGTLTSRILDFFSLIKNFKNISLILTLNGINTHDLIAGKEGAFAEVENTIKRLREFYSKIKITIKFVVTPWNYSDIEKTANYCKKLNLPMVFKMLENVKTYTNSLHYFDNIKTDKFGFSNNQIENIMCSLNNIQGFTVTDKRNIKNIIFFLKNNTLKNKCFCTDYSLFINSDGNIYRCRMMEPIGNINYKDFNARDIFKKPGINYQGNKPSACDKCGSFFRFIDS